LSWGIVLFTTVFETAFKDRSLGIVMLPVATVMMAVALAFFPSEVRPLVPALQANRILGIHVTTMVLSYSALSVSFGASILYLLKTARPETAAVTSEIKTSRLPKPSARSPTGPYSSASRC